MGEAERVGCALCGAVVDALPLDWVVSHENGRLLHYCGRCARENLRAIEVRLDQPDW